MNTSAPTAISETINELRKAAEREKGVTRGCARCGNSGFEIVEGKGARRCDHVANDQLRERIAIEVMDLPDDQAQAEFDRRTR